MDRRQPNTFNIIGWGQSLSSNLKRIFLIFENKGNSTSVHANNEIIIHGFIIPFVLKNLRIPFATKLYRGDGIASPQILKDIGRERG